MPTASEAREPHVTGDGSDRSLDSTATKYRLEKRDLLDSARNEPRFLHQLEQPRDRDRIVLRVRANQIGPTTSHALLNDHRGSIV